MRTQNETKAQSLTIVTLPHTSFKHDPIHRYFDTVILLTECPSCLHTFFLKKEVSLFYCTLLVDRMTESERTGLAECHADDTVPLILSSIID